MLQVQVSDGLREGGKGRGDYLRLPGEAHVQLSAPAPPSGGASATAAQAAQGLSVQPLDPAPGAAARRRPPLHQRKGCSGNRFYHH